MGDGWGCLFLGTENAKVSPCCWTMHFPSRGAGEKLLGAQFARPEVPDIDTNTLDQMTDVKSSKRACQNHRVQCNFAI